MKTPSNNNHVVFCGMCKARTNLMINAIYELIMIAVSHRVQERGGLFLKTAVMRLEKCIFTDIIKRKIFVFMCLPTRIM